MQTKKQLIDILNEIKAINDEDGKIKGKLKIQIDDVILDIKRKKINDSEELYTAIHIIGEADFINEKQIVHNFLFHGDDQIRYIALHVLGLHFNLTEYTDDYKELLEKDEEDEMVRDLAASSFGYCYRGTKNQEIIKYLLIVKCTIKIKGIQKSIFYSLLDIMNIPPTIHNHFNKYYQWYDEKPEDFVGFLNSFPESLIPELISLEREESLKRIQQFLRAHGYFDESQLN